MAKTKRIIAIVSLSIIGVLILATLIMAAVPVGHNINCKTPDLIEIYYGGTKKTPTTLYKDSDEFKAVLDYVNNSTKETALNSLFAGNLFSNPKIVPKAYYLSDVSSNSTTFYVNFYYSQPQCLMDGNKKVKTDNDEDYYYKGLCFEVTSTNEKVETNVYIIPYLRTNGEEYSHQDNTNLQYQKYYQINANFANLYNYLKTKNYDNY